MRKIYYPQIFYFHERGVLLSYPSQKEIKIVNQVKLIHFSSFTMKKMYLHQIMNSQLLEKLI